jgi:hypothetical protein
MGMKDVRGRAKREAEYYRANPVQACQVWGRLFVKRREAICSIACQERAKQAEKPSDASQ